MQRARQNKITAPRFIAVEHTLGIFIGVTANYYHESVPPWGLPMSLLHLGIGIRMEQLVRLFHSSLMTQKVAIFSRYTLGYFRLTSGGPESKGVTSRSGTNSGAAPFTQAAIALASPRISSSA